MRTRPATARILSAFCVAMVMLSAACLFAAGPQKEDLFRSGVEAFKSGRLDDAVDAFSRLLEQDPDDARALKNRGVTYMKKNNYDMAIRDFERAEQIDPELSGLHSNLGVAWYYKKAYEKAIRYIDMEIRQNPDNYIAHFNRGLCNTELGRHDEALRDMNRTLELKPDFDWAVRCRNDLAAKTDARFFLQAGAFLKKENAVSLVDTLTEKGFDTAYFEKVLKGKPFYIIRVGMYRTEEDARSARGTLEEKTGIKAIIRKTGFMKTAIDSPP